MEHRARRENSTNNIIRGKKKYYFLFQQRLLRILIPVKFFYNLLVRTGTIHY